MSIFRDLDLGGLQEILFPVIDALGGPDIRGIISEKSSVLAEGAEVLEEAAALLHMAAEAASDGILTNDEISAIVADAPSVRQAVTDLFRAIEGKEL